jgi:cytoskeletal protein RodZ
MSNKDTKSITIALMVLAVILISALIVNISSQRNIFSSSKSSDNSVNNSIKPGVFNSTSDNTSDSTSISESTSISTSTSETISTTNNQDNNATNSNNNKNVTNTTSSTTVTPHTPTQAELNNEKRNNIQNTYGVSVQYGNEFSSSFGSLTDEGAISDMLDSLSIALSNFPSGFFRELSASHLTYRFVAYASENNEA